MREILFRGKRVDNGEWVEGCYAEFVHGLDGYTKPGIQVTRCVPSVANRLTPTYETELVEVIPETIGQYTGLKDKNEDMIFEGDVFVMGDPNIKHTVEWHDTGFMGKQVGTLGSYVGLMYWLDRIEIIGNIHDGVGPW